MKQHSPPNSGVDSLRPGLEDGLEMPGILVRTVLGTALPCSQLQEISSLNANAALALHEMTSHRYTIEVWFAR